MFVGEATKVLPRPRAPCGRRYGPGFEVEADCRRKQSLGKSLGRLLFSGLLLGCVTEEFVGGDKLGVARQQGFQTLSTGSKYLLAEQSVHSAVKVKMR